MKPNTLFQVRFKPSVKPPRGWTHSAHYNVLNYDRHHNKYLIGKTWLPAKYFIKIEVQDAPVFDKPVLRTIKSLKENECIEIPNDAIRDLVLEQAEREGLKWVSGKNAKDGKYSTPHFLCCKSLGFIENTLVIDRFNVPKNKLPASKFVEVPQESSVMNLKRIIDEQCEKDIKLSEQLDGIKHEGGMPVLTHLIKEGIKNAESLPETDWSKVPFPEGYLVPKGIICVNLVDAVWNDFIIPSGYKLKSLQDSAAPYLENLEGFHRTQFDHYSDGYVDACLKSDNLAPLNATDHPNHPEFGKKQEGVLSNLPTAVDLLKHHFDTQFEKQEEPITNQWITNESRVNFKQNIGRRFELVMANGKIEEGIVVMENSVQANDADGGAWSFDVNSDGTLKSGSDSFRFRWISDKPLQPITETQKDECKAAEERIKELERICELRLQDNDGLADECDKWKTMLTATNQHIDKLRDICQIASSTGSKEIMQSVLKSIATGEI